MPPTLGKLPTNPKNGDVVADKYGNVWEYDGRSGNWVDKGVVKAPRTVTEAASGIITPDIFKKLARLKSVYDSDPERFEQLKLRPGVDAYWYYFRSSDKLFKFNPEGPNKLRIEVDRARIFQILMKQVCPGIKGAKGDRGPQGDPGVGGSPEICYSPSAIDSDRMDFAIFVPTPITTPVSLRLYSANALSTQAAQQGGSQMKYWEKYLKANGFDNPSGLVESQFRTAKLERERRASGASIQVAGCSGPLSPIMSGTSDDQILVEVRVDPVTQQVQFTTPGTGQVLLDQNRTRPTLQYDSNTRTLCGSLYLASGGWGSTSSWCLKARQVGPDGQEGDAGRCRISVVECEITDSPVVATCPAISLRADCESEIIYWLCSEILPSSCVEQLSLAPNAAAVSDQDALSAQFASLQITTEACKKVYKFKLELPQDKDQELELAHWSPQPGCVTFKNFENQKFDWIPLTDKPACNESALWTGPDSLRPVKFPWAPVVQAAPETDECCVAEGTMVHTDAGMMPIESAAEGTMVLCPDGAMRPIEKFFENGVKECVRVTLSDGSSVICTPDHKFPVGGTLVQAADLKNYDLIHKAPGLYEWLEVNRPGTTDDYEIGYIVGHILGDGWRTDKSVGVLAHRLDLEQLEYVYGLMAKRFGEKSRRGPSESGIYSYVWSDKATIKWFADYGLYKSLPERRVELPPDLYERPLEFYRGFLSALVNTDGSISKRGQVNIDWSILPQIPAACKTILDYLGVPSTLKRHRQTKNMFTEDIGDCYRVDLLAGNHRGLLPGVCGRKLDNIAIVEGGRKPDPSPVAIAQDQFKSGFVAGAFTFWGSYDPESRRAAVQRKMPAAVREELGGMVPMSGPWFKRNVQDLIGVHFKSDVTVSWAAGYMRAALLGGRKLKKNGDLVITRNDRDEFSRLCTAVAAMGCDYRTSELKTPFGRINYRCVLGRSIDVYRLYCLAGLRDSINEMGLRTARPGHGVVNVRSVDYVGLRRVFDYKVAPHYLMMANGMVLWDCSDDLFYCQNSQECPAIPDPIIIGGGGGGGGGSSGGGSSGGGSSGGGGSTPPDLCLKFTVANPGGLPTTVYNIKLQKVDSHYTWGENVGESTTGMNPPQGAAWRGCAMIKMWGSNYDVQGGSCLVPPLNTPRNRTIPVVVEITKYKTRGNPKGGELVCLIGYPKCPGTGLPTDKKSESGAGTGNWDCSSFFPTRENASGTSAYCKPATAFQPCVAANNLPNCVYDVDRESLLAAKFQAPSDSFLFGQNFTPLLEVVECPSGGGVEPGADITCKTCIGSGATKPPATLKISGKFGCVVLNRIVKTNPLTNSQTVTYEGCKMVSTQGTTNLSSSCTPLVSIQTPVKFVLACQTTQAGDSYGLTLTYPVCGGAANATSVPTTKGDDNGQQVDLTLPAFQCNTRFDGFFKNFKSIVGYGSGTTCPECLNIKVTMPSNTLLGGGDELTIGCGSCVADQPPTQTYNCCVCNGQYVLQGDSFGGSLAFSQIGGVQTATRVLGKSVPGCNTPLVNMAVSYKMTCAGTNVTLQRIYSCCGESNLIQSNTIPMPAQGQDLVFTLPQASEGKCWVYKETLVVKGSCTGSCNSTGGLTGGGSSGGSGSSGTSGTSGSSGGSSGGSGGSTAAPCQSCDDFLFINSNRPAQMFLNDGVGVVPMTRTRIQLPGVPDSQAKIVWLGCATRQVSRAYSRIGPTGNGGVLSNGNFTVPVEFMLICAPGTQPRLDNTTPLNGTTGFTLSINYPTRSPSETIPATSYVLSSQDKEVKFTCSVCSVVSCPDGSYGSSWGILGVGRTVKSSTTGCATRPWSNSWTFDQMTDLYGTSQVTVRINEAGAQSVQSFTQGVFADASDDLILFPAE